ncbi:gag-pol polyprotein [Aphelenchoides avenae]|nr:gag-pol polyprotein [Aphelenchus avenae]
MDFDPTLNISNIALAQTLALRATGCDELCLLYSADAGLHYKTEAQLKLIIQEAIRAAGSSQATQSPEQLISSLNTRLPVFRYDADGDATFESYYNRYSTIITEDGKTLPTTKSLTRGAGTDVLEFTTKLNAACECAAPPLDADQLKCLRSHRGGPQILLREGKRSPVRARKRGVVVQYDFQRKEGRPSEKLQQQAATSWPLTIEGTSSKKPDRPCNGCGGSHWRSDCKYKEAKCNTCGTVGHIQKVPSPNRTNSQAKKDNSKDLRVRFANSDADVNLIKGKLPKVHTDAPPDCSAPIFIDLMLDGQPVKLIADSGADATLLSMEAYKKLGRPWLKALHLYKRMAQMESSATFAVATNARHPGSTAPKTAVTSIPPKISSATELKEALNNRFPSVFSATLGQCNKMKAHLHLKKDAQPVFCRKCPVPNGALPAVDGELDRLEQTGAISRVDYSEWAAPIVAVTKKNDAYLQIELDDESKKLCGITTHRGLYQYNRLPFGVKSAPGIFQSVMDKMLAGIPLARGYLEDVIVGGLRLEEHIDALFQVFERFASYGFHLNLEKCELLVKEIHFLGRIVDANGIRPDPARVKAFKEMPAPHDVHTVKSYLGSLNYYGRFLPQIREVRAPLDKLTLKDTKFEWTPECQEAFERADASSHGLGATISHRFPDGKIKTIEHASRTLTPAERNYGQIEKEGLALIFATDHKPLLAIFGSKKGIPTYTANRLQRWSLTLLAYDFDIKHVKTADFGQADVLSRLMDKQRSKNDDEEVVIAAFFHDDKEADDAYLEILHSGINSSYPVTSDQIADETAKDELLQQRRDSLSVVTPPRRKDSSSPAGPMLLTGNRVVVPPTLRSQMLKTLHFCHPGIVRMKALARENVYWPGIDSDIETLVKSCPQCARAARQPVKHELAPWPVTNECWSRIHIDYAGPVEGKMLLVVVDSHSKWLDIGSVNKADTASTTEDFCRKHGIEHLTTPPGHPQSNGQAERFVDTTKQALLKLQGQGSFTDRLMSFLMAYRSTPSDTLGGSTKTERRHINQLRSRSSPDALFAVPSSQPVPTPPPSPRRPDTPRGTLPASPHSTPRSTPRSSPASSPRTPPRRSPSPAPQQTPRRRYPLRNRNANNRWGLQPLDPRNYGRD